MYGVKAIWLAAWITLRITIGASAGATARPEVSIVACSTGASVGGGTAEAPPLSDGASGSVVVPAVVVVVVPGTAAVVDVGVVAWRPEAPVAEISAAWRSTAALTTFLICWTVVGP